MNFKHRDKRAAAPRGLALATCVIVGLGCKANPEAKPEANPEASEAASDTSEAEPTSATNEPLRSFERLLVYLPSEALSVAYDRLERRLDPAVVEVVFALPPKAGSLLDERSMLDQGLDIVLDDEADPSNWLDPTSLTFTVPLTKTPYVLRPLTKPAAEVGPLLDHGFSKNTVDGVDMWLPTRSFPWRVALLDGDVAAFIPVDAMGSGLEPLLAAREAENSAVEAELHKALSQDPSVEFVLFAGGPLVHLDVAQPIAQVQFALRRIGPSYEGQVALTPANDVDSCISELRARKHPEENHQVQGLLAAVNFTIEQGAVIGNLAIDPDSLKHFVRR